MANNGSTDLGTLGDTILQRLEQLAECSEPGPGVTRKPFTSEHKQAQKLLQQWMIDAGLTVRMDDAGTLIGRREGNITSRTLLLGSHQDSIPQGGRYDGILGVVLPIVCLEQLVDTALPFSVEVLAFADEEGVRFPTALLGPRALAGTLDPAVLDGLDESGISLREALLDYDLNPHGITDIARQSNELLGFIEVHIEQGPVLENRELPIGVVTSICGIERWQVTLTGRAAHAGTTPMDLRRDALAGAAEVISHLETYCRERDELVGVVGALSVAPNAVNVIPAAVHFSVELRSGRDQIREQAGRDIDTFINQIAAQRALQTNSERTYAQQAVVCDESLSNALAAACESIAQEPFRLMSGATHDASAMSDVCKVAMLFVRCKGGVSHHHEESITAQDAQIAADALISFLENLSD